MHFNLDSANGIVFMHSRIGIDMSKKTEHLASQIIEEAKRLIPKLSSKGIIFPENERVPMDLIDSDFQTITPKEDSNGIIWLLTMYKEGFDPSFVIAHEDYDDIELIMPTPTVIVDEHKQVSEIRYHITDQYMQEIILNLAKIEFFSHQFISGNFQTPLEFSCLEKPEAGVTIFEASIPQFELNISYMFRDGKCVLNVVFPDGDDPTPRLSLPFDENLKPFN